MVHVHPPSPTQCNTTTQLVLKLTVQLSQVYNVTVHASGTCLLCDGMLYNQLEGDE